MSKFHFVFALAILAATSGCSRTDPSQADSLPESYASPKSDLAQQGSGSESLLAHLKKGMAYADLRKLAVDGGWSPVIDRECKSNVIGSNYAELCSAHPALDDCRVCGDLPELGSCSGDGYCGMTFSRDAKILDVTTYGMIEDRAVTGTSSRLQVTGWSLGGKKVP